MSLVGFDVGGTFTDVVAFDQETRRFRIAKVPTSGADPSAGCIDGLQRLGIPLASMRALIHGTTVGTNAVLQRRGARAGLITTRGFRDVLELGRRTRPKLFGLLGEFHPLIPRDCRLEVDERLDASGNVLVALDEDGLAAAVLQLREAGVEALVVHFLHSYVNPVHERRARAIAADLWPNRFITIGSDVLQEVREFERGTAAALNGYLQPVMARYLGKLGGEFRQRGYGGQLLVMQGNGGVMAESLCVEQSIQTVMSGPAAGAISAARIGMQAGFPNVIGCDMGGTSFDVSLVQDGQPAVSAEKDIDYAMPVYVPMVDIHTVGSGGGSIAQVNRAGLLQVGPLSAGSYPGPICYHRGGAEPTVTDANLMLGRIDPTTLPDVTSSVDHALVRSAFAEKLAAPLGLDVEAAAAAVIRVVNTQMAEAIRMVSIGQGHDPRDFALLAFGGAGPLHAVALARELGVPHVLVPRYPGLTSALGCVLADIRHDFVRYVRRPLAELDPADVDAIFAGHRREGEAMIAAENVEVERVEAIHEADLFYYGQSHFFRIEVAAPGFDLQRVAQDLAVKYQKHFRLELSKMKPMVANLRTAVVGRRPPVDLASLAPPGIGAGPARERRVFFEGGWRDTPVLRREGLAPGAVIAGPAIVEQLDTTVLIEPGATATVDRLGNLIVEVGA